MLVEYLQTSLRHAQYEILEEDKSFYGEIPGFQGAYAHAPPWKSVMNNLKRYWKNGYFSGFIRIYHYHK